MVAFWSERKFNVSRCGLWKGMAEIHCHLLPAVDDGVKSAGEALQLLGFMEQEVEVRNVRVTPHVMTDFNSGSSAPLTDKFDDFKALCSGQIQLDLAAEYMLDVNFCQCLSRGDLLPLGKWGDWELILVETPCTMSPLGLEEVLEDIARAGYVPVIAHPERYVYMNEWKYLELAEECLLQLNVPSLYGQYGEKVRKLAEWLLDNKMYHFAGFDIHCYERYVRVIQGLELGRKRLKGLCELLDNNKSIG